MNLSQVQAKKSLSSGMVLKSAVLLGIVIAFSVFFATGLHHELTLATLKSHQIELQQFYAKSPWLVVGGFLACYLPVIILNFPGGTIFGLVAGALFGTLAGTVLVSFASTIGATIACALSRYLFRDLVQRRFSERLKQINAGLDDEGALYLFSLRLLPVIPFFIINLVMGLTTIRLTTFYWVSQLGMLPGTFLFVNAGNQLGLIDSPAGIISPSLLSALALIGLFPLISKRLFVWKRASQRSKQQLQKGENKPSLLPETVLNQLRDIENRCTECGACVRNCAFLSHYGTPKAIAANQDFTQAVAQSMAYECSLCGLCTAVCPEKLDPGKLFLDLRRTFVTNGQFNESTYKTILRYENLGRSKLFSWQGIPDGCDTIFFPGCNLPGSRMATTVQLFESLRRTIPKLGMVLNCCNKPSHDLGRQEHFEAAFGALRQSLQNQGVRRVLVACPNCYKIFQQYGKGLAVQTVYEVIKAEVTIPLAKIWKTVCVHDPCAMRDADNVQQSVRRLVADLGLEQVEMKHRGHRTLCCGEGGTVNAVRPSFAKGWANMRAKESGGRILVTYCAGCCSFLERVVPTVHITDLLFLPETTRPGKKSATRAPFTYLQRLRLKKRLQKEPSLSGSGTHNPKKK
jgi:uncharacterized membrane protein YdjX (TVP38/TMEM64 family)/Fe-S oxidoreductase